MVTNQGSVVNESASSGDNRTVKLPLMVCTLSCSGARFSWKKKHALRELNEFVLVPFRQLSRGSSVGPHDVLLRKL